MKLSISGIFNKVAEFGSFIASKVVGSSKAQEAASRALQKVVIIPITTPLHEACKAAKEDVGAVALLLKSPGAAQALTTLDSKGMTPMHHACENGHLRIVEELLSLNGYNFVTQLTRDGYFPLMLAVAAAVAERDATKKQAYEAIAKLLLKAGADVEGKDSLGMTPFIRACEGKSWNLGRLFLDHKANVNAVNSFGVSALRCVEDLDWVEFLLENGADVNMKAPDGSTALIQACADNRVEIVKALLDHGAYPNEGVSLKHALEYPPLHLACANNNLEIARALLAAGARTDLFPNGKTALDFCLNKGYEAMIDLLLQHGATSSSGVNRARIVARYPKYQAVFNDLDDLRYIATKKLALANHIKDQKDASIAFEGWEASIFYQDIGKKVSEVEFDTLISGEELSRAFEKASHETNPDEVAKAAMKELLVILQAGWIEHHITLVFYGGYLAICNRGEGSRDKTIELYKIDARKVTPDLIKEIEKAHSLKAKEGAAFFYGTLLKKLSAYEDRFCKRVRDATVSPLQTVGNCPFAAPAAALVAAMGLLATVDRKYDDETLDDVRVVSRDILLDLRLNYLESYLVAHPEGGHEYLVNESWKKMKKRLKRYPISLDSYPQIRKQLVEPANEPFYKRAAESVKRTTSKLKDRVEAVAADLLVPSLV